MPGISYTQRSIAWNVEFLDNGDKSFAGLYQAQNMLTYRDAFDELKLCFQLDHYDALALWQTTLDNENQMPDDVCVHAAGSADALDRPIRLQPTSSLGTPSQKTRYVLLNHYRERCTQGSMLDVKYHIAGNCAVLIPTPSRRQHSFYRPINQTSNDPNLPRTPRRSSRSPTKRSGSQSPAKRTAGEVFESFPSSVDEIRGEAIESFLHGQDAKKAIADFRSTAEERGECCAISGLGGGWTRGMVVGPGIHACHIVSQSAWDLYPLLEDDGDEDEDAYSRRRLQRKWESTWGGENALWMQASIHDAHDGRILAIHPKTLKIRSFAPYDVVLPYHNTTAHLSPEYLPDPRALKFQWESCVIENMTAKNPWRTPIEQPPDSGVMASKGRQILATKRPRIGETSDTSILEEPNTDALQMSRSATQPATKDSVADKLLPCSPSLPDLDISMSSRTSHTELLGSDSEPVEPDVCHMNPKKRRWFRMADDSHITAENAKFFLADVNWELRHFKRGRLD